MPVTPDPTQWFWAIGGNTSVVYSSLFNEFIPTSNAAYQAWQSEGGYPTQLATETDLNNYLVSQNLNPVSNSVVITLTDFYNRFTTQEQIGLEAASLSNAEVSYWKTQAIVSGSINLSNSVVVEGVNVLATIGVIAADRVSQILTP